MQTRISVYKLYTKSKALYIQIYQAAVSPLCHVKTFLLQLVPHKVLTASSLRLSFYMGTESQTHLHAHLHKHYIQSRTHSMALWQQASNYFISRVHERWIQCMEEVSKTHRQHVWTKARCFYPLVHRLGLTFKYWHSWEVKHDYKRGECVVSLVLHVDFLVTFHTSLSLLSTPWPLRTPSSV